jgi:hypothetical protein
MDQRRTLLVLRHAQTEDVRPGSRDSERRLTPDGERDAEQVGDYLREQEIMIDTVLCSSAARARQTLELLKLDQLDPDRLEIADLFYNAGGDTLLNAVRDLPDDCHSRIARWACTGRAGTCPRADRCCYVQPGSRCRNRESVPSRSPGQAGLRRRLVTARLRVAGDCANARFSRLLILPVRLGQSLPTSCVTLQPATRRMADALTRLDSSSKPPSIDAENLPRARQ